MSTYNLYYEPISTTKDGKTIKKYSLRQKINEKKQPKFISPFEESKRQHQYNHKISVKQQYGLVNERIVEKNISYSNPTDDNIMELNKYSSINVKNHQKALSTTPSINFTRYNHPSNAYDNVNTTPFMMQSNTHQLQSHTSSQFNLNPSHSKFQLNAVSQNITKSLPNNSFQRMKTQNHSEPTIQTLNFQYDDRRSERTDKQKLSLRNVSKTCSNIRPQFFICLKYEDLKQPIKSMKNQVRYNSLNMIELAQHPNKHQKSSFAYSLLCNNIRYSKQGCQCQPKCFWIDRWINIIGDKPINQTSLQLKHSQWDANVKQIEKDLPRTQPQHLTFKSPLYMNALRQVLVSYVKLDYEVGYVQGMNFLGASLVYHSKNTFQAIKILEFIMKEIGFRKIFIKDLTLSRIVSSNCIIELKKFAFDLHSHLIAEGVQIQIFLASWYFSMLGSFIPLQSMHLVIDKFIRRQFAGLNEIILTFLIFMKSHLLKLHQHQLLLAFSNHQLAKLALTVDWLDLVARSDHLLLPHLLL